MSSDPKDVEFYAAQVNAWLNTRFELDRSLLTLSAAGIGVLITVVLAKGVKSIAELLIYCAALISFVVCLGAVLWIFRRNSDHLEKVVRGDSSDDGLLSALDMIASRAFIIGVLLACLIGISSAIDSLIQHKGVEMTDEKQPENGTIIANESFSGLKKMQPQQLEKSLNGISNMKPEGQPTAQQGSSQSQPAPSQAGEVKK